jgi:exosortase
LWIAWRKRYVLREIAEDYITGKNLISLLILIFGILLYLFGRRQNYLLFSSLSLIPVLWGLTGFLYGKQFTKALAFPILYLILLIPPPFAILDSITLPMRYGIASMTESFLQFIGYPISRNGLMLTIGYNDIFMGAPCSGFRSLITMISLVMVYVYMTKGSRFKKILLVSFITPAALLGNFIRVVTLCLVTFYFGEEAGQGFFHNFSGIVIFIITISGLLIIESIYDSIAKRTSAGEVVSR